jgi:hypothetical protein
MEKQKIIDLITENEHEEALKIMGDFAAQYTPQYNSEITNHKRTLDNLEDDQRIGVISRDKFSRDTTRLTMAMLKLLDLIDSNRANTQPMKQEIPVRYTESLKENMKSVFEMLDDYNRKLSFTSDAMEKAGIKYKIEKCVENLSYYIGQFAKDNSNLTNQQIIEKAKEIIKGEEGKVNIGNINISGGNVQIADTITNNGIDETTIEAILKKVLNK